MGSRVVLAARGGTVGGRLVRHPGTVDVGVSDALEGGVDAVVGDLVGGDALAVGVAAAGAALGVAQVRVALGGAPGAARALVAPGGVVAVAHTVGVAVVEVVFVLFLPPPKLLVVNHSTHCACGVCIQQRLVRIPTLQCPA